MNEYCVGRNGSRRWTGSRATLPLSRSVTYARHKAHASTSEASLSGQECKRLFATRGSVESFNTKALVHLTRRDSPLFRHVLTCQSLWSTLFNGFCTAVIPSQSLHAHKEGGHLFAVRMKPQVHPGRRQDPRCITDDLRHLPEAGELYWILKCGGSLLVMHCVGLRSISLAYRSVLTAIYPFFLVITILVGVLPRMNGHLQSLGIDAQRLHIFSLSLPIPVALTCLLLLLLSLTLSLNKQKNNNERSQLYTLE